MNPTRRRRLWLVVLVVFAVAGATALAMTALRQNLQHFYSPTELTEGKAPPERRFRLGGVVAEGSTQRASCPAIHPARSPTRSGAPEGPSTRPAPSASGTTTTRMSGIVRATTDNFRRRPVWTVS